MDASREGNERRRCLKEDATLSFADPGEAIDGVLDYFNIRVFTIKRCSRCTRFNMLNGMLTGEAIIDFGSHLTRKQPTNKSNTAA
jgi:hypothetical protein